jgi:hypothetical protein
MWRAFERRGDAKLTDLLVALANLPALAGLFEAVYRLGV